MREHPQPAIWLFTRGRQSVRLVRKENLDGRFTLLVEGPGAEGDSRDFAELTTCVSHQGSLERRLLAEGFNLQQHTVDRRRGSDRRQSPPVRRGRRRTDPPPPGHGPGGTPNAPIVAALLAATLWALPCSATAQQRPATGEELTQAGAAALDQRRFPEALASFESAARLEPENASAWFGAGLAAFMLGRNSEAEAALTRAVGLQAALTDGSLLLGELQYRGGRLRDAILTYEAALTHAPNETRLHTRLAAWRAELGVEGRFLESRGAHFRVRFEGPEDQALARRAVEMLEDAYLRTGAALQAYPSQPVEVILYSLRQFQDITRLPSWAAGLYDGRIRVPIRGATASLDELQRVLDHEYVHALVSSIGGPLIPMWLNEGLATVLEPDGLRDAQRVISRAAAPRLPLTELHGSFDTLAPGQARIAYAQSTIAVARMLERGAPAVVTLLRDLATGTPFETAFRRRIGVPYSEFQQDLLR